MKKPLTENFKKTPIGFIPKDWEISTLGAEFSVSAGGDWDAAHSSRIRDLAHPYPIVANALYRDGVLGYCSYYTVRGKAVTVTGRGDVGKAVYRPVPFVPIVRLLALVPNRGSSAKFYADYINTRVKFALESTGVPQLTAPQLRPYEVARPSNAEQRAIAGVLSDVNALIIATDRLIAKKRAIMQGLMQQLLTGGTRLAGFKEPWQTVFLGDVARIKTGSRNNQDKKDGARYPFFVRSATVERIDSYSYDCEAILVPGEGGIGSILHYINGRFEVHQRVYKISHFSEAVVGKFVYYYMQIFFGKHALENSVKATVDSIRLPTFRAFVMTIPSSRREQEAIVALLDNASNELGVLNKRLVKAKAIKQGMMQELLTGRTRLPLMEAPG